MGTISMRGAVPARLLPVLAGMGLAVMAMTSTALAQVPNGPISIVVGAPAGGGNDIVARLIADHLGRDLGVPVVVENRPGASGARAAEYMASTPPDGNTLLLGNVATHAINSVLVETTFDPSEDSEAVASIGVSPNIVVVSPALDVETIEDLVVLAEETPGGLNFGSAGPGGSVHLSGELFKLATGIDAVHVPYAGSGPMLIDLMAGVVDYAIDNFPSSASHVRSGDLRAIAITSPETWPLMPELPTLIDLGMEDFSIVTWYGLFAPAGTPPEIIATLNESVARFLATEEAETQLGNLGALPLEMSLDDFNAFLLEQQVLWAEVVERAEVVLE